jgi:F420-dependent oxidoreductase-like protein
MKIALTLNHMANPVESLARAVAFEAAGGDEVWVPETWGFDAPSLMGAIAARTTRIGIGAVLPVYSRSPALIAQTAAGVDALSGGRALLGLGTSGHQVVEGWHGVPFRRPLGELREAVTACRTTWKRDLLEVDGPRPIPLPGGTGRALRMITRPERASIPITLAALAPGGVRLAAEVSDRWWPLFVTPDAIRGFWAEPLAEGGALRDASLGPLEVMASAIACVGTGAVADEARAAARREIAFYVGSMGSRERNYYASAVAGMGFAVEVDAIQSAALGGDRRGAEALVSDAMLDELALIGDAPYVRKTLAALGDCGVTTLSLGPATPDPLAAVAGIRGALV